VGSRRQVFAPIGHKETRCENQRKIAPYVLRFLTVASKRLLIGSDVAWTFDFSQTGRCVLLAAVVAFPKTLNCQRLTDLIEEMRTAELPLWLSAFRT
jgi:hypothetical protein